MSEQTTSDEAEDDDRINLDYIKGNLFRTITPHGALSSITPSGDVQIALFTERQPIPQRVVRKFSSSGELGEIIEVIGRDSVVREVEFVLNLQLDLAIYLRNTLTDVISELEEAKEEGAE